MAHRPADAAATLRRHVAAASRHRPPGRPLQALRQHRRPRRAVGDGPSRGHGRLVLGPGLPQVRPRPRRALARGPHGLVSDAYQQHTAQTVTGRVVEAAIRRTAARPMPAARRRAATAVVPDADMGGPLAPGARLLDVGAGNGTAVRALRAAGVDAHGIEPEARAVAAARAAGRDDGRRWGRSRTTRSPAERGTSSA